MNSSKYKNEKQIIFTRYSESEKCILDVHNKTDYKIFVYDRGKEKLNLPVSDRIIHIYDENNGREDGGYLRHIIDNYNNYSGIVVFLFIIVCVKLNLDNTVRAIVFQAFTYCLF